MNTKSKANYPKCCLQREHLTSFPYYAEYIDFWFQACAQNKKLNKLDSSFVLFYFPDCLFFFLHSVFFFFSLVVGLSVDLTKVQVVGTPDFPSCLPVKSDRLSACSSAQFTRSLLFRYFSKDFFLLQELL